MENPDSLTVLINLKKYAVDVPPLPKAKTADLTLCPFGLAGEGTPVRKFFQRVQAVDELFEPLRPTDRSTLGDPIVDLVSIGLGSVSENDLIGHVSCGTLSRTS